MATKSKPKAVEAGSELPGGYQPELKRTLGSLQVFAISFAFISVAVGIFGAYDDLRQTGGVVLMVAVPGNALIQLITAGSVLIVVIYGVTVVLYLAVRKGLDRKEGAFSLGRFELPVAISAMVWVVVALVVLVVPASAHVPDAIAAGLALAGGVFFLAMLKFNRKVLETEPAAGDVLEH